MRSDSEWFPLEHHKGHEINREGQVRNAQTGNILNSSVNQTGVRYVSIRNTTEGRYENKSLSVLVAETFCERPTVLLDTVLHRDGNQENVRAGNLMWANRWHAISFHKEINEPRYHAHRRLYDDHGNRYDSIAKAASATGALPSNIEHALRYNDNLATDEHLNFVQRVAPGNHVFRSVPV